MEGNKSEPKKHHYVPQSYLKNFTDPDEKGLFWVRIGTEEKPLWRRRGPKSVAYEINYYSQTEKDGTTHNKLETYLSEIENDSSKVIAKLLRGKALTLEERTTFALCVATMYLRVPLARTTTNLRMNRLVQEWGIRLRQHYLDKPEDLEKYVEQRNAESEQQHSAEYYLRFLDPNQITIQVTEQTAMGTALEMIPLFAHILLGMGWLFLSSEKPNYFITSDTPVTIMKPLDPYHKEQGIMQPDAEVTLPLSRNMAFLAWWQNSKVAYGRVKADNVRNINGRTITLGRKYLIAPKKQFPLSDEVEDIWNSSRVRVPG